MENKNSEHKDNEVMELIGGSIQNIHECCADSMNEVIENKIYRIMNIVTE